MTTRDRLDAPAGLPAVARTGTALATVPAQLREIAEAGGTDAAMAILEAYAGSEIDIPVRPGPNSWLTKTVGSEVAERICAHFRIQNADGREVGGVHIYVPMANTGAMARAKAQLHEDLRAGVSAPTAARRAGLSERTAYKLLARMRDDRQGELF